MKIENLERASELKDELTEANNDIDRLLGVGIVTVNGVTFSSVSTYEAIEHIRKIALNLAKQRIERVQKEIAELE